MTHRALILISFLFFTSCLAHAGSVTLATSRSAFNDVAYWPGNCRQNLHSVLSTSTNGVTITATDAGKSIDTDIQQPPGCPYDGWSGNFAPGDDLLYTNAHGPLTLTFGKGIFGAGAQIGSNGYGGFTAKICDNLGDCFTENGIETKNADNSAIFIGLLDTSPGITSITFDLTGTNDFSINEVSLKDSVATTPEPSSLILFATSLLGLAPFRRKLFGK